MIIAIDSAKPLYLSLAHVGLDPEKVQLDLRGAGTTTPMLAPILAVGSKDKGTIQTAIAVLDGQSGALGFDDLFTWDPERAQWHGYLEVRIAPIGGAAPVDYYAIDYLELATSLKTVSLLRVPQEYPTVQEAIDTAFTAHLMQRMKTFEETLQQEKRPAGVSP